MAKIFIVGCGDVGSRLAVALAGAGHTVFGLRRTPFSLPGVQALTGDVTVPGALQPPAGLDYVFVLLAPGESGEAAYRRVYVDGTRQLLAALAGQRLTQLFWVSSSSVYGQDDGRWVDEDSPAQPAAATAQVLLASEALARESGWPATVVRLAGLYGPGRLRLLRWLESGRPVQAAPPAWTNRIHVADAAGLLAFLLARREAGHGLEALYLGCDSAPAPQHEVLDWLAAQRGRPALPHETRPGAGANKRLSNRRIVELGYRLAFPDYRSGYTEVLAGLR